VHDTFDLERRGVPAAFVASSEFVDATRAQAQALGCDPAVVYVPHPIQDRTDEEMRAIADAAFPKILRALSASDEEV
jgi:hypothetical protein